MSIAFSLYSPNVKKYRLKTENKLLKKIVQDSWKSNLPPKKLKIEKGREEV
jgi:hypothetical protein